MIITRANDRRLRLTATDWVKNGDRWTITRIGRRGDLTVRHTRSQLTVRLPLDYVHTSTGLGYATTIHPAQGVSPTPRRSCSSLKPVTTKQRCRADGDPGRRPL